ncbi:MAG TPA: hypothetical protein VNT77_02155 [Allosphingosinicella sp.]|nr:hypothetical protein [Allosphingosinicella sp.]
MDERKEREVQASREPNAARPGDPNAEAPPPSKTSWGFTWGCLGLLVILGIIIALTQINP